MAEKPYQVQEVCKEVCKRSHLLDFVASPLFFSLSVGVNLHDEKQLTAIKVIVRVNMSCYLFFDFVVRNHGSVEKDCAFFASTLIFSFVDFSRNILPFIFSKLFPQIPFFELNFILNFAIRELSWLNVKHET